MRVADREIWLLRATFRPGAALRLWRQDAAHSVAEHPGSNRVRAAGACGTRSHTDRPVGLRQATRFERHRIPCHEPERRGVEYRRRDSGRPRDR